MKHFRLEKVKNPNENQEKSALSGFKQIYTFSEYKPMVGEGEVIKIGDFVKVTDGSYNIEIATFKHRHGIDPLFQREKAVVISTKANVLALQSMHDLLIRLNLVIGFPDGTIIHTTECCVSKCE